MDVIPQFGVDPDLFTPPRPRVDHDARSTSPMSDASCLKRGVTCLLDALVGVTGRLASDLPGQWSSGALRHQASAQGLCRSGFPSWTGCPQRRCRTSTGTVDVLVLPSLPRPNWTEQFGRVLIEAMASEVAVVGSDVGEIPHVIGDAGVVFPPGDATTLADVLQSLIDDPAQRVDLGRLGRRESWRISLSRASPMRPWQCIRKLRPMNRLQQWQRLVRARVYYTACGQPPTLR